MNMIKKVLAVVMCIALIASISTMGMAVSAEESVTGAMWFPAKAERQNDTLWEVEAEKEGCLCQAFDANPDDTGMNAYLSTTYGDDGSLTIARTGADGEDFYWPRIRTLQLEDYPLMNWNVANTLYFDFEATNAQWNLMLGINGLNVKLAKYITAATGGAALGSTQDDGVAGVYQGSINIPEVIADIVANETVDAESKAGAQAFTNMGENTFVPQVTFFYVGDTSGSIKINKLYMTAAEDADGANCTYMDMGAIYGPEFYEISEDEPAEEPAEDTEEPVDEPAEDTEEPAEDTEEPVVDDDKADEEGGFPVWLIIVIAAVVVVAVVVVIVVMKKKK